MMNLLPIYYRSAGIYYRSGGMSLVGSRRLGSLHSKGLWLIVR